VSSLEQSAHTATQTVLCCEPACPDYAKDGFSRCPAHLLQRRPMRPMGRPPMRLELIGDLPDEYWLTPEECALSVRIAPNNISRWIREGRLPALLLGERSIRVRQEDWIGFVRARMTGE
jgi:hypothetical protein